MWKCLNSGRSLSDHCVLRCARPAGCRAVAPGLRLTFSETVTDRVQLVVESAARWRDSLPRRRFERDLMGLRRVAATRPFGRRGGHGRGDFVAAAAHRNHVYPHAQHRNAEDLGHS